MLFLVAATVMLLSPDTEVALLHKALNPKYLHTTREPCVTQQWY